MYRLIDEEFEVQNGNLIINETKVQICIFCDDFRDMKIKIGSYTV